VGEFLGGFDMAYIKILFIIVSLLNTSVVFAENNPANEPKAIHALCAAANAILASQGEEGLMDEIIRYEARRHAEAARKLGATDQDIEQFVQTMAQEYNAGRMTWDEISDLAYKCTELRSPQSN
jgi:hypothetical protein